MKTPFFERPKVTRVTIKVKSPVHGSIRTEIELESDEEINETNFPYWPIIIFASDFSFKIPVGTDREWNNSLETVTYVIPGKAIDDPELGIMIADVALDYDTCAFGYLEENH